MSTDLDSAVPAPGIDSAIAWHYGDPLREQRILTTRAGVIDRTNRDVLSVSGEERLSWLHTICSQHVAALADGDSTQSLVLSPHGHVEQHWQVTELGGVVWIDTEPGAAGTVLGYLQMMRFLKRVEPADVSADWAVVSLVGPATVDVLSTAALPAPEAGRAIALPGGGFVRRMVWPGADAADLIVGRTDAAATIETLRSAGAELAGIWAFEALRVQARQPRLGFETDHRTIAHEVGWIGPAVHLDKGCYRGQETVARVQNLGKPPRRLVLLHLGGESDELPPAGTPVELAGGRAVGFLGTAVHHHELGPIALAVLKRSLADDTELTVLGSPVAIDAG
ncbi:MAG: folate-binding protein YgfZ [Pseudonocardiales bacterium]|nr:MAG: folate-binding protein YgfZ [Pseudonocardiales bacterium]